MRAVYPFVLGATWIGLAIGCEGSNATRAGDGGRDDHTEASSARDARICEASAPLPSSDASPLGEEPPAHCVAPCVWRLMKNCLVSSPCTTETIAPIEASSNPFGGGSVTCAAGGLVWDIASNGHDSSSDEFFSRGCPCYSFAAVGGGAPSVLVYQWFDAADRIVATGDDAGNVVCGPFDALHSAAVHFPGEARLGDGGLMAGFVEYRLDAQSADCARWLRPQCAKGTCSSDPPKLPRRL